MNDPKEKNLDANFQTFDKEKGQGEVNSSSEYALSVSPSAKSKNKKIRYFPSGSPIPKWISNSYKIHRVKHSLQRDYISYYFTLIFREIENLEFKDPYTVYYAVKDKFQTVLNTKQMLLHDMVFTLIDCIMEKSRKNLDFSVSMTNKKQRRRISKKEIGSNRSQRTLDMTENSPRFNRFRLGDVNIHHGEAGECKLEEKVQNLEKINNQLKNNMKTIEESTKLSFIEVERQLSEIEKNQKLDKSRILEEMEKLRQENKKRTIEVDGYYEKFRNSERERKDQEQEIMYYRSKNDEKEIAIDFLRKSFQDFKQKIKGKLAGFLEGIKLFRGVKEVFNTRCTEVKKACFFVVEKMNKKIKKEQTQLRHLETQVMDLHGLLKQAMKFQKRSKGALEAEIFKIRDKVKKLKQEKLSMQEEINYLKTKKVE